jgi:hypothetical protein
MWFRIDPKTMMATRLCEDGPPFAPHAQLSASHDGLLWWGIVGAKGSNLYRVSVDEAKLMTPASRDWRPPTPPLGNAAPASIVELTANPLVAGGRIGGTLLLSRAKEPPFTRKVIISVFRGNQRLARSSQPIILTTRNANNPLLRYPWLARVENAASMAADAFVIHEPSEYRVEISICSDDDQERVFDHRTLNLTSK